MSHNRDLSAAAAQLGFHSSNIGIGSETPQNRLDVAGDIKILDNSPRLFFYDANANGASSATGGFEVFDKDGNKNVFVGAFAPNADNLIFGVTGSERLRITSGGSVGINTTVPAEKLDVVGTIRASAGTNQYMHMYPVAGAGYFDVRNSTSYPSIVFRQIGSGGTQERLRITSDGNVGINDTAPSQKLNVGGNIMLEGSDQYLYLTNVGTGNAGIYVRGRDATNELRSHSTGMFTWEVTGGEKMRLDSAGRLLLNSGTDVRIELGTTGSTGTNNRNHLRGDGANMKYNCCSGGGHFFEANGGERMRITSTGQLNIGDAHLTQTSSYLHVGRSSGGTAAGESIIAATLGDSTTMVSALLTVKNAGNRGAKGATGGSPLAKFEFNNGTALEVDKYGRLTTPYQPSFGCIKNGNQYPTSGQRTTIASWTEHFDEGSNFNATTGVFTAPVAGKYYFYVSAMMDRNDNGDYQIAIYRNGSMYYNSNDMLSNSGVTYMQTTICGVVEMSANDTVEFKMYNSTSTSSFIYTNHYTHCGGYLIG